MVRKLSVLLISLMLILCMTPNVFAASGEQMTIDIAQDLLDFMKENLVIGPSQYGTPGDNSNALTNLNKYSAEEIANSFNTNFYNMFRNYTELENEILLENITCYFSYFADTVSLYFVVSNNSSPNGNPLAFQKLQQNTENINQFQISSYGESTDYIYGTYLNIQSNGLYWQSASKLEGSSTSRLFSNFNPIIEPEFNEDSSVIYLPYQYSLSGAQEVYYDINTDNPKFYIIGNGYEVEFEPVYPPSGDTGSGDTGGGTVTPSGDTGGGTTTPDYNEKLDNIQTGINNVNQNLDNISGELNEVNNNLTTVPELSGEVLNSGDIIGALGFEFAEDPYSNFWLELTTGLGNAFTDEVRSINVQFRENTHQINLDDFSIQMPGVLKVFLTTISTVFICWKMLKYWKIIIDNITSGNMDEVLSMNEEERYY